MPDSRIKLSLVRDIGSTTQESFFYHIELADQHLCSLLLGACKDDQLTLRWPGHEH